jgi:hypothetical protein
MEKGFAMATVTEADKIQILLAEYTSLRDEVMQRDSSLNQFLIYGAISIVAIIGFMIQYPSATAASVTLLLLDGALVFFGFKMIEFDVLRIATRLLEIEKLVNERAGEQLLVWESTHGIARQGYRYRVRHALYGFVGLFTFGLWRPRVKLWSGAKGE